MPVQVAYLGEGGIYSRKITLTLALYRTPCGIMEKYLNFGDLVSIDSVKSLFLWFV